MVARTKTAAAVQPEPAVQQQTAPTEDVEALKAKIDKLKALLRFHTGRDFDDV